MQVKISKHDLYVSGVHISVVNLIDIDGLVPAIWRWEAGRAYKSTFQRAVSSWTFICCFNDQTIYGRKMKTSIVVFLYFFFLFYLFVCFLSEKCCPRQDLAGEMPDLHTWQYDNWVYKFPFPYEFLHVRLLFVSDTSKLIWHLKAIYSNSFICLKRVPRRLPLSMANLIQTQPGLLEYAMRCEYSNTELIIHSKKHNWKNCSVMAVK